MSIKGTRKAAGEQQAAAKQRKRGPSAAQRKRWQLGTAVTAESHGPPARGSFDEAGTSAASLPAVATRDSLTKSQAAATRDAMGGSPTASAASDARSPCEAAVGSTPQHPQHSGFSGQKEVAQVEGGISPFRAMQAEHADGGRQGGASDAPGDSRPARVLRAGSTDSIDSSSSVDSVGPSSRGPSVRQECPVSHSFCCQLVQPVAGPLGPFDALLLARAPHPVAAEGAK